MGQRRNLVLLINFLVLAKFAGQINAIYFRGKENPPDRRSADFAFVSCTQTRARKRKVQYYNVKPKNYQRVFTILPMCVSTRFSVA